MHESPTPASEPQEAPPPPAWMGATAVGLVILHGGFATVLLMSIMKSAGWVLVYVAGLLPALGCCNPTSRRRFEAIAGFVMVILQALLGIGDLATTWVKIENGDPMMFAGLGGVFAVAVTGFATFVFFLSRASTAAFRRKAQRSREG